jgi:sn-glycerol 3-phosphate transport system permease protein
MSDAGLAPGAAALGEVAAGAARDAPNGRRRLGRTGREAAVGYLFVLPAMAIFAVFVFYPLVRTFWLGFFRVAPYPTIPSKFVGLSQYKSVLTSHDFWASLGRTVEFVILTVPIGILLGVGLATLADARIRGIRFFRTLYSSTVATSVAVASVIFFTLLNPTVGLFSYWLGIEGGNGILQSNTWALPAVATVTVWQNIGFTFILMSAALQAIPQDLLEAARIDGAGGRRRFWRVTLPLLSPTVFFAGVVGIIASFQAFGQIDLLTQGGPDNHTMVLIYYLYTSFQNNDFGTASVLATALFFILLAVTLVQFRFIERRVFYG